jgi:hypothetical protein
MLRLEAAPLLGDSDAATRLAAERAAENRQLEASAAEIVARVEAALDKIGQVLEGVHVFARQPGTRLLAKRLRDAALSWPRRTASWPVCPAPTLLSLILFDN